MGSNPIPSASPAAPLHEPMPPTTLQPPQPLPLLGRASEAAPSADAPAYYVWTVGCQMNTADSERLGAALEGAGLRQARHPKEADVVVLNSCVVRQNAEDKVVGMLTSLKPWREAQPGRTLALMGCMVGPKKDGLRRSYPYVDAFMQPQDFQPLIDLLGERLGIDAEGCVGPFVPGNPSVTTHVPIIHGCDKFCTFCIIPYRRGREVSRPVDELVRECGMLAARGVKEVTLLGQNVDSYGHDLPGAPDLADLLEAAHDEVPELARIRFLTSHPNDMSGRIIDAVARLPRVMENINLPFQAGNDEVLARMKRGYANADYRALVARIRETVPRAAMVTDLIVGFPGETEAQFEDTLAMVRDLRFDKVHAAAYSTRPNTYAQRRYEDDVPAEEKRRRLKSVEAAQESILAEANALLVGSTQEVLVEGRKNGRWQGRTRTGKIVAFESGGAEPSGDLLGQLVDVRITGASPWSLQGAA